MLLDSGRVVRLVSTFVAGLSDVAADSTLSQSSSLPSFGPSLRFQPIFPQTRYQRQTVGPLLLLLLLRHQLMRLSFADLATLFPRYINIRRGQVIVALVGGEFTYLIWPAFKDWFWTCPAACAPVHRTNPGLTGWCMVPWKILASATTFYNFISGKSTPCFSRTSWGPALIPATPQATPSSWAPSLAW